MKKLSLSIVLFITVLSAYGKTNVTGRVLTGGKPLSGVPVTDGITIVTTDSKGKYELETADGSKFLYLTMPSDFEIPMENGIPTLFTEIKPDNHGNFKHDFNLTKVNNPTDKHVLFVVADPQVYFDENMNEVGVAAVEMKELLETEYPGQDGIGIVVGDNVGNIKEAGHFNPWMISEINKCGFPFFYVCGNHDIDLTASTNEEARETFNSYFGPTYYSFNRGKVHYVVLDDVFWTGRNYCGYLPKTQLDWLAQDLALLPKGSTVIIAMHIPCYSREARHQEWGKEDPKKILANRQRLFNMLKSYNAHIMSGHEHYNENYILGDKLYEHCHAPLSTLFWCAPWAMDGTPGGYAVYEINGDNVNWYYKSIGRDKDYQFELYPKGVSVEHPEAIVANIWNIDSSWKVEWMEDGIPMGKMTRYTGHDPNIYNDVAKNGQSYAFPYVGADLTEHLFFAVPEKDESVITVKVTDHNGNVYTSTIKNRKIE